jgi:hypothetical protein
LCWIGHYYQGKLEVKAEDNVERTEGRKQKAEGRKRTQVKCKV